MFIKPVYGYGYVPALPALVLLIPNNNNTIAIIVIQYKFIFAVGGLLVIVVKFLRVFNQFSQWKQT